VIDIEQIIREVSTKTGVDRDTVAAICKHPFIQAVKIMKDETDTYDILFNSLFKFKLKRRYKENKTNPYTSK
jgi:hypothetical protein